MASAASKEEPSHLQRCPQCTRQFQNPRLLPCFHTVCHSCLTLLLHNHDDFSCPVCQTKVVRPPGGADAYPVDVVMEDLVLRSGGAVSVVCELCQTGDAAHKCVQCSQLMCQACSNVHARIAATRSHTLLTLTSSSSAPGIPSSAPEKLVQVPDRCCSIHTEEKVRFFCTQCQTVICRDCKLTTHQPHPTEDLSSASHRMLNSMQEVTDLCQNQLQPKLWQSLQEALQHKASFAVRASEVLAQVKERASEIKTFLDKHVAEAEEQVSQASDDLEDVLKNMEGTLASLELMQQRVTHTSYNTGSSLCPADVATLFLHVQQFFCGAPSGKSSASSARGNQQVFFGNKPVALPVNPVADSSPERFKIFTQEKWRQDLEVSQQTSAAPYGFGGGFGGGVGFGGGFGRGVGGGLFGQPPTTNAHAFGASDPAPYKASVVRYVGTVKTITPRHASPQHAGLFGAPPQPRHVPTEVPRHIQKELSNIQRILAGRPSAVHVPVTGS